MKKFRKISLLIFFMVMVSFYVTKECKAEGEPVYSLEINGVSYKNVDADVEIPWDGQLEYHIKHIIVQDQYLGAPMKPCLNVLNSIIEGEKLTYVYKVTLKSSRLENGEYDFKTRFHMTTNLQDHFDHLDSFKGNKLVKSNIIVGLTDAAELQGFEYQLQMEDDLKKLLKDDLKDKKGVKFESLTPEMFKVKKNKKLVYTKVDEEHYWGTTWSIIASGSGILQVSHGNRIEFVKIIRLDESFESPNFQKISKDKLKIWKKKKGLINGEENIKWRVEIKNKNGKKTVKTLDYGNGSFTVNIPQNSTITYSLNWEENGKTVTKNWGMSKFQFKNGLKGMKKGKKYNYKNWDKVGIKLLN